LFVVRRQLPLPLLRVCHAVEALRVALARACDRALLESAEITLLQYRPGASYRRHLDDRVGITLGSGKTTVRRSLSLLIYLTPDDWTAADGGALRVHAHAGMATPAVVDVVPEAGTLVLFDSATVPHEVLPTQRERTVLAGWLQEMR
jgi:SM-20-related protein